MQAFTNVVAGRYWSGTTAWAIPPTYTLAYGLNMATGNHEALGWKDTDFAYVWPICFR